MLRAINFRTPFLYKVCRSYSTVNLARNELPYSSQEYDRITKDIVLLRLAVCPTAQVNICRNDDYQESSTLAGDPRSISSEREEIRAEVLAKWNQRPQLDTEKEWIKHSIHY
ncbi:unnamed protein product [Arctia plantaginis]|uniref:Uncharacterized protein n=1 Tax=Arctia plantaginis TaxID=874455 RepID=A0A8S1AHY9_ARCPL|nr:unnamed protein product [Arctia plantaginis]